MPTLKGPTIGSGYATARILCTYTEVADGDGSEFDADLYFETDNRISDSSNDWEISGDLGSKSGSNKNIDHGSGGGKTFLGSVKKTVKKDANVYCEISGVNYIGKTVSATFTLEVKLASTKVPTIEKVASKAVGKTSFTADLVSWTANGTISSTEAEYGKTKSNTDKATASGAKDIEVTGLSPGTTYYFRMRIKNSAGWSKWSDWGSLATTFSKPGVPKSTWSIKNVTAISAETSGCAVSDNGGSPISQYQVQYNTSKSATGASSSASSSNPTMSNLSPDTLYYARIRASNAAGWSDYTDWKSFRTLAGVFVKHSGTWKSGEVYVKWNGTWKLGRLYVKKGGVWV